MLAFVKKKPNYRKNYDSAVYKSNDPRRDRYYYNDDTNSADWNDDERQDRSRNYNAYYVKDKGYYTNQISNKNNDSRGKRTGQGFNDFYDNENVNKGNRLKSDMQNNSQFTDWTRRNDNSSYSSNEHYNDSNDRVESNAKTFQNDHYTNSHGKNLSEAPSEYKCDNFDTDTDGWVLASSKKKASQYIMFN